MGNGQSVLQHEPNNPYSSATASFQKPTKSAMRKLLSQSIRQEADVLSHHDRTTKSRYIPNMNPRTAGNGLIIPTRPYGGHTSVDKTAASSEMSPQWGWYINTTPPTPELYHSRSSSLSSSSSSAPSKHQSTKGDTTDGIQTLSSRSDSSTIDGKSCQNQVFRNLQNSTKTNVMEGWTSIPI